MEQCHSCGAALAADADWCGQCYAVRRPPAAAASVMTPLAAPIGTPAGGAPVAPGVGSPGAPAAVPLPGSGPGSGSSIMSPARTANAQQTLTPTPHKTRWRKTATTFGPVGRILATIGLVLPFVFFVVVGVVTGGFTIAGAVIWGFVIMPWGLRDTWKAGQLPAR